MAFLKFLFTPKFSLQIYIYIEQQKSESRPVIVITCSIHIFNMLFSSTFLWYKYAEETDSLSFLFREHNKLQKHSESQNVLFLCTFSHRQTDKTNHRDDHDATVNKSTHAPRLTDQLRIQFTIIIIIKRKFMRVYHSLALKSRHTGRDVTSRQLTCGGCSWCTFRMHHGERELQFGTKKWHDCPRQRRSN